MKIDNIKEKIKDWNPGFIGDVKHFSVLIPLVEIDGDVHVLLEVRSAKIKTQPGDVCFPGGKQEENETIIECALRETWEETGIPPEDVEIVGEFDIQHEPERMALHTVVGVLKEETLKKVKINPDEVETVFTVPLKFFKENEPAIYYSLFTQTAEDFPYEKYGIDRNYRWSRFKREIPVYMYDGFVIWGITCRIIRWFVKKMDF